MRRIFSAFLLAAACFAAGLFAAGAAPRAAAAPEPAADPWQKVGDGKHLGISGAALVGQEGDVKRFLCVHDGKKPGRPRVTLVTLDADGRITSNALLAWPAGREEPVDLEAASAIPGKPGHALLLASGGRLVHVEVVSGRGVGDSLEVRRVVDLPPAPTDYEGLSVERVGGRLVAALAARGGGATPARIEVGEFDPETDRIAVRATAEFTAPYPDPKDPNTRHAGDVKLVPLGILWVSATNDPGDAGPFRSAVYAAGLVRVEGDRIRFEANPALAPLWAFSRKVEAIEVVPGAAGGVLFGADDEDLGGWIRFR